MQSLKALCRVAAFIVAVSPVAVHADLPVHCLRHQVAGEWEFTLGPPGPKRSSCGHQKPDNPNSQPALNFLESQGSTSTVRFSLRDPSTAVAEDGAAGMWTMIYDEGFEVAVGDQVYFAFSDFEFVQDDQKGRTNVSHCDKTQVGWYHNSDRTSWGCYFGRKVDKSVDSVDDAMRMEAPAQPKLRAGRKASLAWMSSEQTFLGADEDEAPMKDDEDVKPAPAVEAAVQKNTDFLMPSDVISNPDAALADYKPWVPGSAGYDKPMPDQWQQNVADALNFLQLGWTAASYAHKFQGKSPKDLNRFAGVRRHLPHKHVNPEAASFSSLLGVSSKVTRHHRRMSSDTFDWRNKDGKNWLEPVVTQGDCGSCYTISTVHMLTARNKIRHGDTSQPTFSVTFPLFCSEYNQGCDGGYGFLQSKWSEDVGLVPESCSPFAQDGSCHALHNCDLGEKRYRAINHHYVGGFYGGSEADKIQRELVQSGPVVMSFEPKEDFMYYKQGIYRSGANKIHQEWEQVDHAVLLIGYGEESGQAYWTMQNSWGEDWGEEGYFRMARGIDESGCESIVVAADVAEESSNPVLDDFLASL